LSVDGQLLLDKPAGITSFSALNGLKRSLGTGRIGHAGTLDKFATGLLIVLIGRYTKLAELFSGLDKCYRAALVLGSRTDTLDPEGQVIEEGPLPDLRRIEEAADRLRGTIDQIPPVYSAVHVGGRRAYRIARCGGEPKLEPRRVTIHRLEIVDYRAPELDIAVECSKGTYVRALARDLGSLAGSCAYVKSLRRTRVGPYDVQEALPIDAASGVPLPAAAAQLPGSVQRLLRLDGIRALTVNERSVTEVRNGQELKDSFFYGTPQTDGLYTLLDRAGNLLALAVRDFGKYHYKMVL
jgi:tRNA pseudouridine55 synthase